MGYLDNTGLSRFWDNIKGKFGADLSISGNKLSLKNKNGSALCTVNIPPAYDGYLVDSGVKKATTGTNKFDWYYEKFSNGIIKMWTGWQTLQGVNITTSANGAYTNATAYNVGIPFTLKSVLDIRGNVRISKVWAHITLDPISWTSTTFDACFHCDASFSNLDLNYNYYVVGLWKDMSAPTEYTGSHEPYPVGSIYLSVNDTNPSTYFGGTWERIQDTFLLAAGSTYAAGTTGGEATHELTVNEMPEHWHTLRFAGNAAELWTTSTQFSSGSKSQIISYGTGKAGVDITGSGGSAAHNNMPPYLAVYVWKRTA